MIKVTDGIERVVHWILAGSCLFCLITGIGFMYHSWSFIATFLGGPYAMKWMHIFSGLAFAVSFVYSFFMWKKDCQFEAQDLQWVLKGGGYLWNVKDLPPVYKYNAGHKAFFWILVADIMLLGLCGVMPAEQPWVALSQVAAAYYFAHFLIILPLLARFETPKPLPHSISESVLRMIDWWPLK